MRISEIYAAIQGETQYAGLPCALVRLAGCDLRCSYCDTRYAFTEGMPMHLDEVMARVRELGFRLVLVTGGEPLLQRETVELCARLMQGGHRVLVETSGAHDICVLPDGVIRIVDVKTPGSGECHRNMWSNLAVLGPADAVKFVLCDRADYLFALETMQRYRWTAETLFSPVYGRLAAKDLWQWMLKDRVAARLNLQLHKLVFGEETRGV